MNRSLKIALLALAGASMAALSSCSSSPKEDTSSSSKPAQTSQSQTTSQSQISQPASSEPSSSEVSASEVSLSEVSVSESTSTHTHEIEEGYHHDDDKHWKECKTCGEKFDEEEHAFGDWANDHAPTIYEAGSKYRLCSVCGYRDEEIIPALSAHNSFAKYDDAFYIGSYPQARLTDEATIVSLNSGVELPTEEDHKDWNAYNWYYNNEQHDYAFYRDVDINNDGKNDYRGIVLLGRRPELGTTALGTNTSQNYLELNTIYWYIYQPIEWNLLNGFYDMSGRMTLIANKLLDSNPIHGYDGGNNAFDHNGGVAYSSSYAFSDLRVWLNNDFLQTAMSEDQLAIMQKLTLQETNSADSQVIDMNDYVYLPSRNEVASYDNKAAEITAYSRAMNGYKVDAYNHNNWFLRDAYEGDSSHAHNRMYGVSNAGTIGTSQGGHYYWSNKTSLGIRPTITIKEPAKLGTIQLSSENVAQGTVNAASILAPIGDTVNLKATANPGYIFIGWFDGQTKVSDDALLEYTMAENNPSYVAKFEVSTNTPYEVHHLTRGKGQTSFVQVSSMDEVKYGTTGAMTEAQADQSMASDYDILPFSQVTIKGDGSTIVEIRYDWKKQTVTIVSPDHCTITGATSGDYDHGTVLHLIATPDPGYRFVTWRENNYMLPIQYHESNFTVPNNPITWTCEVAPLSNNDYNVVAHGQALGETDAFTVDLGTQTFHNGTTDQPLDSSAIPSFEGFTYQSHDLTPISATTSNIINAYYTRNSHKAYIALASDSAAKGHAEIANETIDGYYEFQYQEQMNITAIADTGYHFVGWFNEENTLVQEAATLAITGGDSDLHYQMKFAPNTDTSYKIECYGQPVDTTGETEADNFSTHLKDLTFSGTTDTMIPTYNEGGAPEAFDIAGFTYHGGETNKNINGDGTGVAKAYYTRNQHTLTWDFAGGAPSGDYTAASNVYFDAEIIYPALQRAGYTFAGWSCDVAKMPDSNLTITANWTSNTYSISYQLNGGSEVENPATYTVESDSFTLVNPEKEGYDFVGWTGTGLDQASDNVTIAKGSTGDRSYAATWSLIDYNITYHNVEGATNANPATYNITSSITLVDPVKENYTFLGWYSDAEMKQEVTGIEVGSKGDIDLYAKFCLTSLMGYTVSADGVNYTQMSFVPESDWPEEDGLIGEYVLNIENKVGGSLSFKLNGEDIEHVDFYGHCDESTLLYPHSTVYLKIYSNGSYAVWVGRNTEHIGIDTNSFASLFADDAKVVIYCFGADGHLGDIYLSSDDTEIMLPEGTTGIIVLRLDPTAEEIYWEADARCWGKSSDLTPTNGKFLTYDGYQSFSKYMNFSWQE